MLPELKIGNLVARYPIIQGGMGVGISLSSLAGAVAKSGGIGVISAAQPGWRDLTAVKSGNYAFLPKDMFHFKPNAQWAQAYEILAELLYPELNIHGEHQN